MGLSFSRLWGALFNRRRESRILMIGLDAAGKTTVLYKLKLGEVVTTIATVGFNVETVQYKSVDMTVFDVGGQDKIRPLWKHYFQNADAVIFVVDSADKERFQMARDELHMVLADSLLSDAILLVFANKQDLQQRANVKEVSEALELHKMRDRAWHIQGASAVGGDGLYEGLDWLVNTLQKKK